MLASLLAGAALCGVMTSDVFAAEAYQEAGFEDENLYACVVRQYNVDVSMEDEIAEDEVLSDEQLASIDKLFCDYVEGSSDDALSSTFYDANDPATSLVGIEKLTGLTELHVSDHGKHFAGGTDWEVDLSESVSLKYIGLHGNKLISLILPDSDELERMNIGGNALETLDLSGKSRLRWLEVSWNHLDNLDLSDCSGLVSLAANHNLFTEIDLSNNKKLTGVGVVDTAVIELDVSKQPDLVELFVPEDTMVKPYPDYKINDECELTLGLRFVGKYNTILKTEHYSFNNDTHLLTIKSLPVNNIVETNADDYENTYELFESSVYKLDLGNELTTEFKKTKDCVPKSSEESDIKVPDTGGSVAEEQNAHIMEISLVALGVVAALGFIGNYIRDRLQHRVKF